MNDQIKKLVDVIILAHKRGSFSLEESAIIYNLIKEVENNKDFVKKPKTTLEMIQEEDESKELE